MSAQTEGGVEAVGGRDVGHLEGDGFDGSHSGHVSYGSAAGASRFLTGLVACSVTHDGVPAARCRAEAAAETYRALAASVPLFAAASASSKASSSRSHPPKAASQAR